MKKLLFILPLLYYSCTDAINYADIVALQTENTEQDAQIDSLLTILTEQQAYIDSLNNAQNIADSLNNLTMQSYIDSLINEGELTDSLLQVYTDSLNTVQNAYIDSLHNAQQTTLTALANSALSAGFVETEVFSGVVPNSWTDLDLSSVVDSKTSLVLLKYNYNSGDNHGYISVRTNGSSYSNTGHSGINTIYLQTVNYPSAFVMVLTDSNGVIESACINDDLNVTASIVFYLNQNDTINP